MFVIIAVSLRILSKKIGSNTINGSPLMKKLYVLRHAEKDGTGILTEEGRQAAAELHTRLGHFDFVYSSDKPRAVETAKLLTRKEAIIDTRASAIALTPEELKDIHEQGKLHLFGIAGVLFDSDIYRPRIIERGRELVKLIEEVLGKLSDDERALIISHDGVMVAASMILRHKELQKADTTFKPLHGFRVFGDVCVKDVR